MVTAMLQGDHGHEWKDRRTMGRLYSHHHVTKD